MSKTNRDVQSTFISPLINNDADKQTFALVRVFGGKRTLHEGGEQTFRCVERRIVRVVRSGLVSQRKSSHVRYVRRARSSRCVSWGTLAPRSDARARRARPTARSRRSSDAPTDWFARGRLRTYSRSYVHPRRRVARNGRLVLVWSRALSPSRREIGRAHV